jgi:7-cyano-7-deazaguanine reductase
MSEQYQQLKALGNHATQYPDTYNPCVLESFSNNFPKNDYIVEIEAPEFTSLCPKTAQPDFAEINIQYCPDMLLVESKSLKLYLFSFRNEGSFHENCVNKICHDLFDLMQPKWIVVRGDFMPRGGISINPVASLIKPGFSGQEGRQL